MPAYHSIPQDVLFFRDGRPMEAGAGSGGHGARWPEPSIIFDAIHAALHRAFPVPEETAKSADQLKACLEQNNWLWQHPHRFISRPGSGAARDRNPDERFRNQRFGALQTSGPFPAVCQDASQDTYTWLFPAPADYVPDEHTDNPFLCPLRSSGGSANRPPPLIYSLGNPCGPSKVEVTPWWNKAAVEAALRGEKPSPDGLWEKAELYADEWTTGIGIDPVRQTQDGERIYSAQYLRLREDSAVGYSVNLGFTATLPLSRAHNGDNDGMKKLFPAHDLIICGGQQRACRVEEANGVSGLETLLPVSQSSSVQAASDGKWRVKWVLLSPAVFPFISETSPGGWLPNWVAAKDGSDHSRPFKAGDVLLKPDVPPKQPGERRETWRKRIARDVPPLNAQLVAARAPKPVVITGWSERLHQILNDPRADSEAAQLKHGPRPTLLAVPAGAVYYFEAADKPGAESLVAALSWHGQKTRSVSEIKNRRSTLMGEKGFGLGVCGTWEFFPDTANSAKSPGNAFGLKL